MPDLVEIDAPVAAVNNRAAAKMVEDDADDGGDDDESDTLADDECACLLCASRLPSAHGAFQHAMLEHGFDFQALRRKHGACSVLVHHFKQARYKRH